MKNKRRVKKNNNSSSHSFYTTPERQLSDEEVYNLASKAHSHDPLGLNSSTSFIQAEADRRYKRASGHDPLGLYS